MEYETASFLFSDEKKWAIVKRMIEMECEKRQYFLFYWNREGINPFPFEYIWPKMFFF